MGFLKQIFVSAMSFVGCNLSSVNPLKFVSMNNQECKVRPQIMNLNNNEPSFYPCSVKINKCSDSCNNINDPCAKMFVSDIVKNLNVRISNLMPRTSEKRYIKLHETWGCKCMLDANVCNNRQKCNNDKCRFKCKELIDKGICD